MAVFAGMLICAIALVTVLVAEGYLAARDLSIGEFQAMLLFSTFGMLMMVSSNHLIVIFASLETLSLALYVLIGFRKTHSDSAEAAVKYFLLGGFASAFFLYGVALVYGKTGSVLLGSELAFTVSPMVRVGVALLIVGIAFKISAVPFHLWTPDVYQGAPTPTTGFLAAASKTAAVVVLLRIVYPAVATDGALWGDLWPWMAAITMIVGNLIALVQHDVKRVLAYSSIAHVGFILMALAGGTSVTVGGHSALFYLVAYVLGTIGAFAAISAIAGDEEDRVDLDQIRGLARSHPLLAGLLALFLLSLSGLPPLVGFAGKLFAFKSAITGGLYYLAIFAALNSAMAVYYYLRIIIRMYMEGRAKPLTFKMTPVAYLPLLLVAAAVIYVGIAPGAFLAAAEMSVRALAPMASLAWLP